jgi:hypothetical protein
MKKATHGVAFCKAGNPQNLNTTPTLPTVAELVKSTLVLPIFLVNLL